MPAQWASQYAARFAGNLAILDGLDTVCGNQLLAGPAPVAGRYNTLATVLADDRSTSTPAPAPATSTWRSRRNAVGITNNDCGGRTPLVDTIDRTYSVLAAGALAGVTDGVDRDADGEHIRPRASRSCCLRTDMTCRLPAVPLLLLAACGGTPAAVRTTDPGIALANLDATIEKRERTRERDADRAVPELIDLLLQRGQFRARVSDYERASALAREWVARDPGPRALLARARTQATLHLFAPALADLDRASALGADPDVVDAARAAVLQGLGRYDDALRIRRRLVRLRADVSAIGAEAAVLAEQGRVAEAVPRFRDARRSYRDASPFALAWIDFQEGRMWMRLGDLSRAHERFTAAHERLPAYVAAAGHLGEVEAALGHTDRAVELLSAAAQGSEDPDPAAQLARVLDEAGRTREAGLWRERAASAYGALLARHGDAFADHAAEFWLAAGHDPARALELSRRNAELRPTPWALALLARSAAASGDPAAACRAAGAARAAGHPRPQGILGRGLSC